MVKRVPGRGVLPSPDDSGARSRPRTPASGDRQAVGEDAAAALLGELLGDAHHPRVVGVGDHHAAVGHAGQQLGLGFGDRLEGAEIFEVHRPHVGEDRDVRPAQPGDRGQLAGDRHAHLGDHPLGVRGDAQEGEREAVEVVVVAGAFFGAEGAAEEGGDQFLGGGLAGRAGDAHQVPRGLAADRPGELVQRGEGVGHPDRRDRAARDRGGPPRRRRRPRARGPRNRGRRSFRRARRRKARRRRSCASRSRRPAKRHRRRRRAAFRPSSAAAVPRLR